MDARTLDALRGSIAKWEAIVAGTGQDEGYRNCPLCLLYHPLNIGVDLHGPSACDGCPVKRETGESLCGGSPYDDFEIGEATAQQELDFLRSLLPPEAALTAGQRENESR